MATDTRLCTFTYDSLTYNGTNIGATTPSNIALATSEEAFAYTAADLSGSQELWIVTKTEKKNTFTQNDNTSPFVTTSLKCDVTDTQWFTGDGVTGKSYYSSAAYNILSDMARGNSNKRYQNTGLDSTAISELRTRLTSNMSSIKVAVTADQEDYDGEDFPVLVIDDISSVNAVVNNYLKCLTNTSYDFYRGYSDGTSYNGSDRAIYNVDISKWRYNSASGEFELQEGEEASLKCSANNRFYILPTVLDNEDWQISLIDVQFYDPDNIPEFSGTSRTDEGLIVYHLYVPVVVKKMLYYTVQIRPAATTTYKLDAYPSSVANLVENLGNPITMKVTYTYNQDAQAWEDAINGGENVCRNYNKTLTIKDNSNAFPANAIMVMVDPNNDVDKYYYTNFSDAIDGSPESDGGIPVYKLNLNSTTFSGFNLVNINDLLNISIDDTAGTKNLVEWVDGDEDPCIAIVNSGNNKGLKLRYKNDNDDANTTYYAVDVSLKDHQNNGTYVQENYYISIFTGTNISDNTIYHYEVKSYGNSFNDSEYPSARLGTQEAPHLFLGNLYNNTVTIKETNPNRVMSETNTYLSADLEAKVGFTNNAINAHITDYLGNANVKIYQTFMVGLNRLNGTQPSQRGILVDPSSVSPSDYKINGASPDSTAYSLGYDILSNYIVLTNEYNIKDDLKNAATNGEEDHTITIKEKVNLLYSSGSLSTQFPPATEETSTTTGTYMIGYSNISSTSDGGASSKASKNTVDSGRLTYYMGDDTSVFFTYNAVANDDFEDDGNANYGQLGLDGYQMDEEGENYIQINTAGYYNVYDYNRKLEADYVKITVKLSKKSNYNTALNISTYLDDFKILDKYDNPIGQIVNNPDTTEDETDVIVVKNDASNIYTYIVPKNLLKELSPDAYTIPIQFRAYSGNNTDFQGKNLEYSNYRVTVTVGLLATKNINATILNHSDGSDHIIYTNARLYSDVIDTSGSGSGSGSGD